MAEPVELMSIESGAGNQRSRELVEERRAKAYSMYLKGFSEKQIAESLHVNQSTISRALAARRRENVALFGGVEGENFLQSFLQEEKDRYLDLLQEEWNHYYSIGDHNVKGRSQGLGVIRATLAAMGNMVGRIVAELDTLRVGKQVNELLKRVYDLEKRQPGPSLLPSPPALDREIFLLEQGIVTKLGSNSRSVLMQALAILRPNDSCRSSKRVPCGNCV